MPLPPSRIKQEPAFDGCAPSFGGAYATAIRSHTYKPSISNGVRDRRLGTSSLPFMGGNAYERNNKPRYTLLTDAFGNDPGFDPYHVSQARGRNAFRSLSQAADGELLAYLQVRHISPAFLKDIDFFLDTHPEIAHYQPEWTRKINSFKPVAAYLHFVRGWLRPARYLDSVSFSAGISSGWHCIQSVKVC